MPQRCQGITKSGKPCNSFASDSGFCQYHDPALVAARETQQVAEKAQWASGARFREMLGVLGATCEAKGWRHKTTHIDVLTWRFATIEVRKSFSSFLGSVETVSTIEFDVTDGVKLTAYNSTAQENRVRELVKAISHDIKQIPWVKEQIAKNEQKLTPTKFEGRDNAIGVVKRLLEQFPVVAKQLSYRHQGRGTLTIIDEYDVQDLLHALLKIQFNDVRPEDPCPNKAGASSRVDFVLKKEQIIIEAKMSSQRLTDKELGEQFSIDIQRYQSHPDCKSLIFFVYNPQLYIKNPSALVNDFSWCHDKLNVLVIVAPML